MAENTKCRGQGFDERKILKILYRVEELAGKKAKIYSKLLTEPSLAENMAVIAARHEQRLETLKGFLAEEKGEEKKGENSDEE